MARPSSFTPEIGSAICERIADGESRTQVCRDAGMPDRKTVARWLLAEGEQFNAFRDMYATALTIQREHWADEIVEHANGAGDKTDNLTRIRRDELRVNTLKWLLSKLVRSQYGDKVEHLGPDGGAIQHEARVIFVKPDAS